MMPDLQFSALLDSANPAAMSSAFASLLALAADVGAWPADLRRPPMTSMVRGGCEIRLDKDERSMVRCVAGASCLDKDDFGVGAMPEMAAMVFGCRFEDILRNLTRSAMVRCGRDLKHPRSAIDQPFAAKNKVCMKVTEK